MTPRWNAGLEGSRRGLLLVAMQASPAPRAATPDSVTVTAGPQDRAGRVEPLILGPPHPGSLDDAGAGRGARSGARRGRAHTHQARRWAADEVAPLPGRGRQSVRVPVG